MWLSTSDLQPFDDQLQGFDEYQQRFDEEKKWTIHVRLLRRRVRNFAKPDIDIYRITIYQ
jgi:hypothetical protein